MPGVNLVVGDDGSNTLLGGAGKDLIYGFDPNGPQGEVSSIAATRVATGLSGALFAAAPPGDTDHLFIVQQSGTIRVLDLNTGQLQATPFLTVPVDSNGERGLLGLAFDPDYANNGFFYIYRTVPGATAHNEVDRYHVSSNPTVADPASATPIITLNNLSAAANHNAGWIGFGPEGDLYIATGDNANSANAQSTANLLGKILRIDVHSDAFPGDPANNYGIPPDNMFVGTAGADEIFALGLRNPFRDGFDRATGDFYVADVGEGAWEEIDQGRLGANYGWPLFEGPAGSGTVGSGTLTAPIYFYDHTVGHAVIGGYVYRGQSEGLQGQYFFADEVNDKIFTLRFNGSSWVATERTSQITTNVGAINNPTSFGEDARGNLYLTDFDGDVFRLTPLVASADQADTLRGFAGDDMLYGGSGNDLLDGGPGADALSGGPGSDTATYASSPAGVTVNLATGHGIGGDAAGDILTSIENLIGSASADTLIGDGGANSFTGGGGADMMTGGGGNDVFVEMHGGGADTTTDFVPAAGSGDRIDVTAFTNLSNFAGVLAISAQVGPDTLIDFGGGDTLTLQGVARASLSAGNFILARPPFSSDFNADLTSDILWRQDGGFVGAWLMQGGHVNAGVTVGFAVGSDQAAGLGDFNGDNTSDILWRNDSGFVGAWLMQGGHITAGVAIGSAAGSDHVAGVGDFNGDNTSDILWRSDSGFVGEWLMQGGQINAGLPVGFAAGGDHVAGIGDFNGDGTSDILWRNDSGFVGAWLMQGGQINAGLPVGFAAGGDHVAGIGDFNGDGTSDILWRNDSGSVGLWLMQGGHINAGLPVGFAGNDWHVANVGDYDGDGHADILWRNDSGQVGVWLMNGNQILAGVTLGSAPGDWHVIG